jgi:predicted RNase H-like HicB family nuclease
MRTSLSSSQMENLDFDQLLQTYKQAIDAWVNAIRAEEALATPDHSMVAMEHWDTAGLNVQDAEAVAKKARDLYKNALRKKNYGF